MENYRECIGPDGAVMTTQVQRMSDMAFIPADDSNRDWVAYQAWLAEGNTPLAAGTELE